MDIKQYLAIQGSTKGEAQRSSTSRWELGAFWCLPQKALKSHLICVGAGEPGKNQSYLQVLGWAGTDCFRISNIFTSRIKSRVINYWGGGWSPHGGGGGLIAKSCPTLVTPRTVACQVPLSMGFSRQEYWSGLLFPSPGDLPEPGIEPWSPTFQADSLLTELWGKPASHVTYPQLHLSSAVSKMAWAKSLPVMGPRYLLKDLGSGKFSSRIYLFLRKTEIYLRGKKKKVTYGLNCYLCVAYALFPGQHGRQRMHLFCGKEWGQGKKQKPEDCAIMAFLNPSRKFIFRVLWKSRTQLFKKASLSGGCRPYSTVGFFLAIGFSAPPSKDLGAGRPLCLGPALSRPTPK